MKFLYACYGKAGLDCLYQLLNQEECAPGDLFVITYSNQLNRILLEHLNALHINYSTDSITDESLVARIMDFSPDYMFSIYFKDIIKKNVLVSIKKAAVNLHPSLLPDYRGCFSVPWAIINGEKIHANDTAFSLYHRLIALGVENFAVMFQLLVRNDFKGVTQNPGGRFYRRNLPFGGYISLDMGKQKIHKVIRALYFPHFAGAQIKYGDEIF
jgi:methionyl-tRNA formyltransferase